MPQLTTITSEALQATIRRLLPSQQGFGVDLEATNVITPIIDLTATAEGSQLPYELQTAIAFNATYYTALNNTQTLANTPGFYRIQGTVSINKASASAFQSGSLSVKNGATSNRFADFSTVTAGGTISHIQNYDYFVFLDTGDEIEAIATSLVVMRGSVRQIADRYGNLQNPPGFTFE